MNHNKRKITYGSGTNTKKMFIRKLAYNFFKNGVLTLPENRAKKILPVLESLTYRAAKTDEASKNVLLRFFGNITTVRMLQKIASNKVKVFPNGGVITLRKELARFSDGVNMSSVKWTDEAYANN